MTDTDEPSTCFGIRYGASNTLLQGVHPGWYDIDSNLTLISIKG